MSTYTELKGLKVKYLSDDPSPGTVGDVWYNTAGQLKAFIATAAWSAGSNTIDTTNAAGPAGIQTAAISFGGRNPPAPAFVSTSEEYNGSSWTSVTNAMLAGSIANNKLANDSLTIGSTEINLGTSSTTISGLTEVTIDGSGGLKVKNGNTGAGFIEFYENSTNGSNKIKLKGLESTDDITVSLPTTTGTLVSTGDTESVTNDMLAGSIANSKLSNQSVSFGGIPLNLGGVDATPAFNLTDAINYKTSSLSGTITNAQLAGLIENSKLLKDSVSPEYSDLSGILNIQICKFSKSHFDFEVCICFVYFYFYVFCFVLSAIIYNTSAPCLEHIKKLV